MIAVFLFLSCVATSLAATPAPERPISDNVRFYYDPDSQYFVGSTSSNCFMASLTHDERDHILSNQGIEDIELAMMREWLGTLSETRIFHDDPTLPATISKWCHGKDIFLLGRNLGVQTTKGSPLGK